MCVIHFYIYLMIITIKTNSKIYDRKVITDHTRFKKNIIKSIFSQISEHKKFYFILHFILY